MKIISLVIFAVVISLALAAPSHPAGDPKPEMAGQNYAQGEEKARQGKWGEAVTLFRKVIEEDGQHYKAFNMLGYSLRKMGKAKEAIAAYNKALSIKPDYAPALEYRGVAHVMAGNKAAALADLQKLKSLGSPLAEDLGKQIAAMPAN
ncbi:MAG: tetratricopeptide repeat protein [Nitrospinae bacterium]|nr:tetratricopeptide repeat protein [Nitrospinota bacterium]